MAQGISEVLTFAIGVAIRPARSSAQARQQAIAVAARWG